MSWIADGAVSDREPVAVPSKRSVRCYAASGRSGPN